MNEPLNVAIIGLLGINAEKYHPAISRTGDLRIVAGVDPSPEARAAFKLKEPGVALYSSMSQAAANHMIDAVVIGTPNHVHLSNIQEAASLGLHMSVTKPMCNTVAECRQAITAARDAGVILQVGHEYRFRPGIARAIEMANRGDIGDITLVTARMGHLGGITDRHTGVGKWRRDPANCPGGCANLLSVHQIDAATAVLGPAVQVSATLRHLQAHVSIIDTAAITVLHERGMSSCTSSYVSYSNEELIIHGTEATLHANTGSLIIRTRQSERCITDLPQATSADVLIQQLVDAIRHHTDVPTDGIVGMENVGVLEAALLSSHRGCSVPLSAVLSPEELNVAARQVKTVPIAQT